MKKIAGYIGFVCVVFLLGGLGGFLFDYMFFSKIVTHPIWSQHPFVQSMDNRLKIIKNTEKIIVENSESIADIAQRAAASVVFVEALDATGSVSTGNGVVISSDGVIATTSSVVPVGYSVQYVKLADHIVHKVQNINRDLYTGIVFLKIDAQNLATISFANSDDAQSGKRLISIMQSRVNDSPHFSAGGLMGKMHEFTVSTPMSDHLQGVLDIDFVEAVLRNNVGSPLVDYQGNMVGLVAHKIQQSDSGSQDRFYAIAANDVYRAFEEYMRTKDDGEVLSRDRVALGVNYRMINGFDVALQSLTVDSGAIIEAPLQTYAAMTAFNATLGVRSGLRAGDIIIMVNNDVVDARNNLSRLLHKYTRSDDVTLKVVRGKEIITIVIKKE